METPSVQFRELFLDAMRRMAATVSVVTTSASGRAPIGVTVSSLCSLSADPCLVLVCVHHLSRAAAEINQNRVFCVNVLRSNQTTIADCFAGRSAEHEHRFKVGVWSISRNGVPALADAVACLECELQWSKQFASHFILVGKVIDISVKGGLPLVYADRAYRQLTPTALA
jgi:flavin reductase